MSSIYSWNASEPTLTATSTTVVAAADAVLMYSASDARMRQVSIGNISSKIVTESISTSTAAGFVTLSPIGVSIITAAATGGVAIMPAPPSAGLFKMIMMAATSTSTGFQVISGSSAVAIFTTGTSTNTIVPRLQTLFGQNSAYLDLMSVSTSAWTATGMSVGAGAIAFTTTTST